MPHRTVILRCGRHLLVVVDGGDRHKRQEVIGIRPRRGVEEVRRHGGAGEEVVGGGIIDGGRAGTTAGATGSGGGDTLHALEVKTVFLEVASDVFPG